MTTPDPALTAALDKLTLQVNPDNVMAVYKAFSDQADALERELRRQYDQTRLGLCGGDPVSKDAQAAFHVKIDELLAAHWAHQRELVVAAEHVRQIALGYGRTEAEISAMMEARRP